jgi:hypothetical protein
VIIGTVCHSANNVQRDCLCQVRELCEQALWAMLLVIPEQVIDYPTTEAGAGLRVVADVRGAVLVATATVTPAVMMVANAHHR